MKTFFLLGFLCAAQLATAANDTAYAALRVYGKKEGEQALYRVMELRGVHGSPQPGVWKLTVEDLKARGGVRELEIHNGKIVSVRTPLSREVSKAMNFNQLNLDSDGAFTIVNQEAQTAGVAFDRIDYLLHSGSGGGTPIWEVTLTEGPARVGIVRVAADSGTILDRNFSPRTFADDRAYLRDDRVPERPDDRSPRVHVDFDPGQDIGNFLNRIGRHFQKRGRQLNNFFTGRATDETRQ